MTELPATYRRFAELHPSVSRAYESLGEACAQAGPVDDKTRELIKLAIAVGARLEGGVHSHARRALTAGATASEIRHLVTLAVPTVGFPNAAAAFTWIEDVLSAP
jgi:AhpD family alkylhydroperoxidase